MKDTTQEEEHSPTDDTKNCSCENAKHPNAMMARSVRPMVAVAMLLLLYSHGGTASWLFTSKRSLRGSRGLFQYITNGLEATDTADNASEGFNGDTCQGRPRNRNLAWEHDDNWYRECQLHLLQADTEAPRGQWTPSEFTKFLHLQTHTTLADFKQLPLPFTMIFNELSCRCLQYDHENSDCCLGDKARIAPNIDMDDISWMNSICNRVDNALDEVCRRQQGHHNEL
jgi:hypothetical protein